MKLKQLFIKKENIRNCRTLSGVFDVICVTGVICVTSVIGVIGVICVICVIGVIGKPYVKGAKPDLFTQMLGLMAIPLKSHSWPFFWVPWRVFAKSSRNRNLKD